MVPATRRLAFRSYYDLLAFICWQMRVLGGYIILKYWKKRETVQWPLCGLDTILRWFFGTGNTHDSEHSEKKGYFVKGQIPYCQPNSSTSASIVFRGSSCTQLHSRWVWEEKLLGLKKHLLCVNLTRDHWKDVLVLSSIKEEKILTFSNFAVRKKSV